jgi:hypothetical protein
MPWPPVGGCSDWVGTVPLPIAPGFVAAVPPDAPVVACANAEVAPRSSEPAMMIDMAVILMALAPKRYNSSEGSTLEKSLGSDATPSGCGSCP